ncbi:MAG: MFS transporter [Candidatus Kariarchaeaceae archaeon]
MSNSSSKTHDQKTDYRIRTLLKPNVLILLVIVVLIGMGEKMAERFLPLYLYALGGGALSIGLLSGMDNLLSALYSFPGGYLSDKIGYKKALTIFNIMSMIGYSIVIFIETWWAVLIGALFFISWTAISLPAIMSMVSKVIPKSQRTMGVTLHSLVRRFPMAIGPIVGGLLIHQYGLTYGIRLAFSIALELAIFATLLEWLFLEEPPKRKDKPLKLRDSVKNIDRDLKILLASDILVRFAEQIPYAFVVIWAVTMKGITPIEFGILTTIEMVTAVVIYIPVAYFVDRHRKKPFVVITFGFFALFPFVVLFSNSFEIFVIAFIIRGLKEFGEPTRKALIMDLAPSEEKASTFGTYYLIRDIVVSIAAFGGAFLWQIQGNGPAINFLIAGCFGIIGTVIFAIYGNDIVFEEKQG